MVVLKGDKMMTQNVRSKETEVETPFFIALIAAVFTPAGIFVSGSVSMFSTLW